MSLEAGYDRKNDFIKQILSLSHGVFCGDVRDGGGIGFVK
jgi:hypothetical protein